MRLFIATDPSTSAKTSAAKLLYGAWLGVLIFTLRATTAYADSIAFAVLLANASLPLIELCSERFAHEKA